MQNKSIDIRLFKEEFKGSMHFPLLATNSSQKNKIKSVEIKKVSGKENITQAILMRIFANPKELKLHPEYGVGITSYIGTSQDPHLKGKIQQQLQRDQRITQVQYDSFIEKDNRLDIKMNTNVTDQIHLHLSQV